MLAMPSVSRPSPQAAAATPATRTSPAKSSAPSASIRPPRSRVSSAAPCGLISRARYERWSLRLAAGDRGAHGAARFGACRRHLLCDPQRNDRRRYSRAHAWQHRVGVVLRRLRRCRGDPCWDRRAQRADRMVAARSEEHTSELQSLRDLVCRLLLEKKKSPERPRAMPRSHTTRGRRIRSSPLSRRMEESPPRVFFFLRIPRPPTSSLFPYTTLFR